MPVSRPHPFFLLGGTRESEDAFASALAREFDEECGLSISVGALALATQGFFDAEKKRHHELNLVFHVEPRGEIDTASPPESREPHIGFRWAELAEIVDLDLRPTTIKAWVAAGGPWRAGETSDVEWVAEGFEESANPPKTAF